MQFYHEFMNTLPPTPVTVPSTTLSWAAGATAVQAACAEAERLGVRINVAVVDVSGTLVAFLRMPGSFLPSIEIAVDKAYTAAGFGLPTGAWHEILQGHAPAVRDGLPRRPRVVMFGGGLPARQDGVLVGGIGVSGASDTQDEACARAALVALGLTA